MGAPGRPDCRRPGLANSDEGGQTVMSLDAGCLTVLSPRVSWFGGLVQDSSVVAESKSLGDSLAVAIHDRNQQETWIRRLRGVAPNEAQFSPLADELTLKFD